MSKPIYKLHLFRPNSEWFKLSDEEQAGVMEKLKESSMSAGAESLVLCDSSWASEEWFGFGVEKYPNIEAAMKHAEEHNKMGWPFKYGEAFTILGTER